MPNATNAPAPSATADLLAVNDDVLHADCQRVERTRLPGCGPDSYVGIGYSDELGLIVALNVDSDDRERVAAATVYDPADFRREFGGQPATRARVLAVAEGLLAGTLGTPTQRRAFGRCAADAREQWERQAAEYWAEVRAGV